MNGNNLTDKELAQNLWILEHKPQIIKAGKIALVVFNAAVFGWVLFSLGDYWFGSGVQERQNLSTLKYEAIPFAELQVKLTPQPLSTADVLVFGGQGDKYDLGTEIANSNVGMYGEFEYQFVGANFSTKPVRDIILPSTRKWLLQLGYQSPARPLNARLVLTGFSWHRLSRHDYPDYAQFVKDHLSLTTSDISFGHTELAKGTLNQVLFTLTNNSAYRFWQLPINMVLYRGDQIVGFNKIILEKVQSLEARPVAVTWAEGLPAVTRVDVQPDLNILDSGVYMP